MRGILLALALLVSLPAHAVLVDGDVDVRVVGTAGTVDTSATAQTADFTVETGVADLRLLGWTIREDAGTPAVATVVLRNDDDGTCDGTAVVAFIELSANQSLQQSYGDRGLALGAGGLCADVLAGSVSFGAHLVTEAAP